MEKKLGRRDTNTVQAAQLKTAHGTGVHTEGTGSSRQKPEQGEATFYVLVGYNNASRFYQQTKQEQDSTKEDILTPLYSLVLSKIQTPDNLNRYPST